MFSLKLTKTNECYRSNDRKLLLSTIFTLLCIAGHSFQLLLHRHAALFSLGDLHRARDQVRRNESTARGSARQHGRGQRLRRGTLVVFLGDCFGALRPRSRHAVRSNAVCHRRGRRRRRRTTIRRSLEMWRRVGMPIRGRSMDAWLWRRRGFRGRVPCIVSRA